MAYILGKKSFDCFQITEEDSVRENDSKFAAIGNF